MDMDEVCEYMVREHVHRLIVAVDEIKERAEVGPKYRHRPVGIITTKYIVKIFAGGD